MQLRKLSLPRGLVVALGAGVLAAGVAHAQQARPPAAAPAPSPQQAPPAASPQAAPAQPAASAEPERTTATFGDWVLRCERPATAPGSAPAPRVCEVAQAIQVQGQSGPIAQIAIGRVTKADPLRVTIVTPANVSFPSTPRIAVEEKDTQPLDLAWRRCLPGGCFADATLKEENIRRLRSRTEPGRIEFKDAAGRDLAVPLVFRGLPQALDALARE